MRPLYDLCIFSDGAMVAGRPPEALGTLGQYAPQTAPRNG